MFLCTLDDAVDIGEVLWPLAGQFVQLIGAPTRRIREKTLITQVLVPEPELVHN